jgi:dihydroxy-acid dehydratase
VTPEAFVGGPIAIIKNGDPIEIDAEKKVIEIMIPKAELAARLKKWKQPKPRYTKGVLAKYAAQVSSASLGAVTD